MPTFITKFALTKGILKFDAKPHPHGGFSFKPPGKSWNEYVGRRHTHTDPDKAVAAAEKLRAAKIAYHEGELTRLRGLTFEVPA